MRKFIKLITFLVILTFVLFAIHPFILEGMARYLIVQDKLEPADVIIVLSGDSSGERVREGVNLYKKGYAPYLLMTGGPLTWQLTYGQWMKKQAEFMGVPAEFILTEEKSESTLANAKLTLPMVKEKGFKSVILVSSPFHMRRAVRVFQKVYAPHNIKIIAYPVQQSDFDPKHWWTKHEGVDVVAKEYLSSVFYFLRGY